MYVLTNGNVCYISACAFIYIYNHKILILCIIYIKIIKIDFLKKKIGAAMQDVKTLA